MDDIQALLDYNPPSLEIFPDLDTQVSPVPLTFYDKQIDKHLLLEQVVSLPCIPQDLSAMVDQKLLAITSSCVAFPPKDSETTKFPKRARIVNAGISDAFDSLERNGARDLVSLYATTTAAFCKSLASVLGVFPSVSSCWFSLLRWGGKHFAETTIQRYVTEFYALRLDEKCAEEAKLPEGLGQNLKTQLRETYERYPELATWQIIDLSVANEEVIKAMDKAVSTPTFSSETCLTTGHPSLPDIPVPPDALKAPWTIPQLHTNFIKQEDAPWKNTRARSRAHAAAPNSTTTPAKAPTKVTPKKPVKSRKVVKRAVTVAHQLLQHAWARCVLRDTTLVVFYCGTLERIGIRHRQSQTLYLSDVIDVHACKDPAYGKLHVGLYLAALEDALDRVKQQLSTEAQQDFPVGPSVNGKRRLLADEDEDEDPRRKRSKVDPNSQTGEGKVQECQQLKGKRKGKGTTKAVRSSKRNTKGTANTIVNHDTPSFEIEVASRTLALLYIRYGPYNSPSPGSFLRINPETHLPMKLKSNYSLNECVSLILTSRIGSGSTGTVHGATLEVRPSEGAPIIRDVVVKLSFAPEQHERMRSEYRIYRHLAGTPGILHVFGLFEDIEGGALALVMEHGGTSLEDRGESDKVTVSPAEREAFVSVLDGIHDAGVIHHDIRAPNLMVNDDGMVFIVDFDMAELDNNEYVVARESNRLRDLLDGHYVPD